MRIRPHGKKFSFWVNRCTECDDITELSLRKVGGKLCRKCSEKWEQKRRDARAARKNR